MKGYSGVKGKETRVTDWKEIKLAHAYYISITTNANIGISALLAHSY